MNVSVSTSSLKGVTKVTGIVNVTKSNKVKVDDKFLASVSASALKEGTLFQETVNLLQSAAINWGDQAQVKSIARAYRDGRMLGTLKAMPNKSGEPKYPTLTASDIDAWNDLDKSDKEKFSKGDFFKAYRAALSSFTLVCRNAGKPNAKKGASKAAPKGKVTAPSDEVNTVIIPDGSIPLDSPLIKSMRLASEADAAKLAMNVVRIIETSLNGRKEDAKLGDWWQVLTSFVADAKAKAAK